MEITTLDELEKLLAAAQFTEKLCVSYSEIGPPDDGRLCAFLMEGDPDDGIYVAVDESPWDTADPPSPRLEAIATAINALPGLLESARRVEEMQAALVVMSEAADQFGDWDDDDKKLFVALRLRDLRRARAALKAPATRAQGESS